MHGERHLASLEAARAELQGVLASACFQRSPRLSALLSYLCAKTFAGEADHLKEYTIGVDVLGRPESFDPTADAGARVEIHRLRKRLSDFYRDEGAGHSVRIEIPPGQYAPLFVDLDQDRPAASPAGDDLAQAPIEAFSAAEPVEAGRSRGPKLWAGALALVGLGLLIPVFASLRKPASVPPATAPAVAVHRPENPIRIACGRQKTYTDRWGRQWEPDAFVTGGEPYENQKPLIDRAFDPRLFSSGRVGDFEYKIPLAPGIYELRLLFAETVFGAGNVAGGGEASRWFDVAVNGRTVLKSFDVLSDAGGANVAAVRVFKNVSPDPNGNVTIAFRGQRDRAIISAIELAPQQRKDRLNTIRIAAKSMLGWLTSKP